jgi:hypothetical protein
MNGWQIAGVLLLAWSLLQLLVLWVIGQGPNRWFE